jgi:phosphate transport system permease protein
MSAWSSAEVTRQGSTDAAAPRPFSDTVLGAAPAVALAMAVICLGAGCLSLSLNSLDGMRLLLVGLLGASSVFLALHVRYEDSVWSREILLQVAASVAAAGLLAVIPEYTYGYYLNAFIHRSIYTALIFIALGAWATSTAVYYLLGATPTARDRGRFLIVLLPVGLAALVYGLVLARVIQDGVRELSWGALTNAYTEQLSRTVTLDKQIEGAGLRNQILGTFLLMGMTAALSLPIGVGTGVFLSVYGGWMAHSVNVCVSMLRSISVFILGVTAFSLVRYSADHFSSTTGTTTFSDLIRGYFYVEGHFKNPAGGSYLLAAVFLSLLVIPVIARSTEEGCRSVPMDIREGSSALGATDGHLLTRIMLPWALPNIMTGLLLGLAEAAGSVAVLLFIAGGGEHGVGPFKGVTSLAFVVYAAHPGRGTKNFTDIMSRFEFTAAFLLIVITFTLTLAALLLKQRFARRYRGGLLDS